VRGSGIAYRRYCGQPATNSGNFVLLAVLANSRSEFKRTGWANNDSGRIIIPQTDYFTLMKDVPRGRFVTCGFSDVARDLA
jgi:hypothetical protein